MPATAPANGEMYTMRDISMDAYERDMRAYKWYGNTVNYEVRGGFACYSQLKVERYSYPVITTGCAAGILRSIYWHPGVIYHIDRIYVLNPIRYATYKQNMVTHKASNRALRDALGGKGPLPCIIADNHTERDQRTTTCLRDVHYLIEAHFTLDRDSMETPADDRYFEHMPAKTANMLHRRLNHGQQYQLPYLGISDCPANVTPWDGKPKSGYYSDIDEIDLGLMPYEKKYNDYNQIIDQSYFHAVMRNGIIEVAGQKIYH